jgi:bifunctional non-homologous end joining protein LigD
MPLHWSQVRATLEPQRFTMKTTPALLAKSKPWHDYCESEVPLKAAIEQFLIGK